MRIYVFGSGDSLVLPKLSPRLSAMGAGTIYTKPTLDFFYSELGFAFPLDYEGIPFHLIVNNTIPTYDPDHLVASLRTMNYFLIKHDGSLWNISVAATIDGALSYRYSYVYPVTEGWWLTTADPGVPDEDHQMVIGVLASGASRKTIEKHFQQNHCNTVLDYHKVSDIVKTLNQRFPKHKTVEELEREADLELLARVRRRQ
jgi:hypothetical protein